MKTTFFIMMVQAVVLSCLTAGPQPPLKEGRLFYREKFVEFLDSKEIVKLIDHHVGCQTALDENQKKFFSAGFIRGLLDYADFRNYKSGVGFAKYDFEALGMNNMVEKNGWIAGCRAAKSKGDSILEEYSKYLGASDAK